MKKFAGRPQAPGHHPVTRSLCLEGGAQDLSYLPPTLWALAGSCPLGQWEVRVREREVRVRKQKV